jgi:RNA polymerase sigma-70 factor (ECF subfamily)
MEKLIDGLRRGSYNDFQAIYNLYAGNLYGFVFGITRSTELSKDVVQDTFIRVWTNRKSISSAQTFKPWLFKIAQNLVVDEFRKRINHPAFDSYLDYSETLSTPSSIEQQMDFDLFMERLNQSKALLTPRQQEIFELSKEMGFSASEIAARLNISEQTVYNQLSTAIRTLKEGIGNPFTLLFMLFFEMP